MNPSRPLDYDEEAPLTDAEVHEIREALRERRAVKSLGLAGSWIKNMLIWCGVVMGAWFVFWEYIVKLIKDAPR